MSETIYLGGRPGHVHDLSLALARHERHATASTDEHLAACPVGHLDARTHAEWHRWAASLLSAEIAHARRIGAPGTLDRRAREVARRRIAADILADPASTEADRATARRYLRDPGPEPGS